MKFPNLDVRRRVFNNFFLPFERLLLILFINFFFCYPLIAQVNNTGKLYISGNIYVNSNFSNTSSATYQNDGSFSLTGNFTNDQPSVTEGTGTTSFIGTGLQKIKGTQDPVFHNALYNNSAGVEMNVSTTIGGIISPVTGSLYFNGYNLTMGGKINTAYTNTAAFNVTKTSDLTITGPAATGNNLYFDVTANTIHNVTLSSTASGVLGNDLNITAGTSFGTVMVDGIFDAAGFLTLKSDSGGDARIGNSAGIINNNVTVERYIPAKRAWRFLTAPFNSSTQSINTAWQEGQVSTTLTCPTGDPTPQGWGTQITNDNKGNGYDLNTTVNPSLKAQINNAWAPPPSTLTTKITDYPAYYIFIRGDRQICLVYGTYAGSNKTTLRAKGIVNQFGGVNAVTKTYTGTPGEFFLLGNPYASPINLQNVINGGRVNGFDAGKIWVWDPKLAGTYGVGAYVTYTNGIGWVPAGGSYPFGSSNPPIIQSGQGFEVQLSSNSTSATVSIREADKDSTEFNVFGPMSLRMTQQQYPVIFTNLLLQDSITLLDGVATAFANKFSSIVDNYDVQKQLNTGESVALKRDSKSLAVELRPMPIFTDTLFLALYIKQQPYILKIFSASLQGNLSRKAWIIDKYLNLQTEINLYDTTLYRFVPNPDTNSYRNRFVIVFKPNDDKTKYVYNNNGNNGNDENSQTVNIFPNPVAGNSFTLRLKNFKSGKYTANLYDIIGNYLISRNLGYVQGNYDYTFRLPSTITSGNYTINIVSGDGDIVKSISLIKGKD